MRGAKPFTIVPGSSPIKDDMAAPEWLDDDARAEWDLIAPILIKERRTLTSADIACLASYCAAMAQVMQASRTIAAEGMTFMSKNGPRKHPAVSIRSDAMTQARLLAAELGLTPVSRSRSRAQSSPNDGQRNMFDLDF